MFHRKRKLTKILGAKPGSDPPIKYWVKGFILPHMYHNPNFYEDSGLLQLTKNSKKLKIILRAIIYSVAV